MTRRDRFEALFAANPDPWDFRTAPSEQAKFRASRDALSGRRYARGIEVGCANGELTSFLAPLCARLESLDVARSALDLARARVPSPHVRFRQAEVPSDWPGGQADLIVLSEVLYFLTREEIARLADRVAGTLAPGGDVLVVSFTGPTEEPLGGVESAELFIATLTARAEVTPLRQDAGPTWRLWLMRRAGP